MRIKVEQHHIDLGIRAESHSCMVALAIREALPEARVVEVTSFVNINRKDEYKLPYFVSQRIDEYDRGHKILPFEFDMVPFYYDEITKEMKELVKVKA